MQSFICTTCGTQFAPAAAPPAVCPTCADERQYLNPAGQEWATLEALRQSHRNTVQQQEPGLLGIGMEPEFGIGQRALLVRTAVGNVLWDCIALLDNGLAEMIHGIGGLAAVAVSHPHFYTSMVEWGREFDAPILLHAADREWVMRPDPLTEFWEGETRALVDGLSLIRCGGHFAGATVLHWPAGAASCGALLTGDVLQVVQDRRWVSFMRSYPNVIPLPASAVQRIAAAVEPYPFDRIYGAWWDRTIATGAKDAVRRSAERYIRAVTDETEG